ncbi:MAG: AAA family ATPase, partial [Gammaproteobacteria bacterium]
MNHSEIPSDPEQLGRLVAALQKPGCFEHTVKHFEIIETHISIVLLTGEYAYKFKKPVDFGFVDFTTLQKRKHYCEEELRLNSRLAPEIYLQVASITGSIDMPRLDSGPAIEYCVKMRQFPHSAELHNALAQNKVDQSAFRELGTAIACFHEHAEAADQSNDYGSFDQVRNQCLENFSSMADGLPGLPVADDLSMLKTWTGQQLSEQQELIESRRKNGRVRECHGDMHVTNLIWLQDTIQVFDCIEFNPELRWIDCMSEIAFLLMDLDMRQQADKAHVFLDAYLEYGGDYSGLPLLPLFYVYRSLVRAKIAFLQARQDSHKTDTGLLDRIGKHIQLARSSIEISAPASIIITTGLSGSGKTTITEPLIPATGALRVRSDVERKRLAGLNATDRSHSKIGQGLYAAGHTQETYQHLRDCARAVISAKHPVIIDATFLKLSQRRMFQELATELNVPYRILDCQAPESILRERIDQRRGDASEADQ